MDNIYSNDEWKKYAAMNEVLVAFAYEFIKEFCTRSDLTSIEIVGDELNINTEEYFSGCGTDYESYNIPISWLSEPNLMDRCREKIAADKEREIQLQVDRQQKREEGKQAARHKKYLELQQEFEGGNT